MKRYLETNPIDWDRVKRYRIGQEVGYKSSKNGFITASVRGFYPLVKAITFPKINNSLILPKNKKGSYVTDIMLLIL